MAKYYIRTTIGAVTIVSSGGNTLALMVDTRLELEPGDWDQAVSRCYEDGYYLISDDPDSAFGIWEIWNLRPLDKAA